MKGWVTMMMRIISFRGFTLILRGRGIIVNVISNVKSNIINSNHNKINRRTLIHCFPF